MATTSVSGFPVAPSQVPSRTLSVKLLILSSTCHTSGTTSAPSVNICCRHTAKTVRCCMVVGSIMAYQHRQELASAQSHLPWVEYVSQEQLINKHERVCTIAAYAQVEPLLAATGSENASMYSRLSLPRMQGPKGTGQ